MSEPTPGTGATRASVPDQATSDAADPPQSPASKLERAKDAYELVSDVLTPQTLLILLAAAIIGVTGLFGGWNNVATAERALPTLAPSATTTASPFALAAEKGVWFAEQKGAGLYPRPGVRYVMVSLRVTNLTKEPLWTATLNHALVPQLEGREQSGSQPAPPQILQVDDAQALQVLQPGLPYHLVVVWTQQDTAPAPTQLTIDVASHTFRVSSIDAAQDWRDPEAQASVTVPIRPAPVEATKK